MKVTWQFLIYLSLIVFNRSDIFIVFVCPFCYQTWSSAENKYIVCCWGGGISKYNNSSDYNYKPYRKVTRAGLFSIKPMSLLISLAFSLKKSINAYYEGSGELCEPDLFFEILSFKLVADVVGEPAVQAEEGADPGPARQDWGNLWSDCTANCRQDCFSFNILLRKPRFLVPNFC